MCRKVTFRKHKDPRGPDRFKLVKGPVYHSKPAPLSNSIHNLFKVSRPRDPYTRDVSDEVLHYTSNQTWP
jgi:hypothetical protein